MRSKTCRQALTPSTGCGADACVNNICLGQRRCGRAEKPVAGRSTWLPAWVSSIGRRAGKKMCKHSGSAGAAKGGEGRARPTSSTVGRFPIPTGSRWSGQARTRSVQPRTHMLMMTGTRLHARGDARPRPEKSATMPPCARTCVQVQEDSLVRHAARGCLQQPAQAPPHQPGESKPAPHAGRCTERSRMRLVMPSVAWRDLPWVSVGGLSSSAALSEAAPKLFWEGCGSGAPGSSRLFLNCWPSTARGLSPGAAGRWSRGRSECRASLESPSPYCPVTLRCWWSLAKLTRSLGGLRYVSHAGREATPSCYCHRRDRWLRAQRAPRRAGVGATISAVEGHSRGGRQSPARRRAVEGLQQGPERRWPRGHDRSSLGALGRPRHVSTALPFRERGPGARPALRARPGRVPDGLHHESEQP